MGVGIMESKKRYRGVIVRQDGMYYFKSNRGELFDVIADEQVKRCYSSGHVLVVEDCSGLSSFHCMKVVSEIGPNDDPMSEGRAIAEEFNLIRNRSSVALEEASLIPKNVTAEQIKGITDLRDVPFVTIDPDKAHNFDDAVHCQKNSDGTYTLRVAITNIANAIDVKSKLFQEADEIGIDAYVGDMCYPMFPSDLAGGAWSIIEGEDRVVMCTTCTINSDGTLKDYKIEPAVIRNRHRLTYKEADYIAFGENASGDTQDHSDILEKVEDVKDVLDDLYDIAGILFRGRMERGALDINSRALKYILDDSGTKVIGYEREQSEEYTSVIEETAILHNEIWGEVAETLGIPFLYRNHKNIDPMKIDELRHKFADYNIRLPKPIKGKDIQQIIEKVKGKKIEEYVDSCLLKAMESAYCDVNNSGHTGLAIVPMQYRSHKKACEGMCHTASKTAMLESARYRYFMQTGRANGLAFEGDINHSAYAWSSSVVRRMVDLYNQLQMLGVINDGKPMFTNHQLMCKIEHLNEAEQQAGMANAEYNKMQGAKYAIDNIGQVFPSCRIVDMNRDGVTIMTPDGFKMTMSKSATGKGKYVKIGDEIKGVAIASATTYPPRVVAKKVANCGGRSM